MAPATNRTAEDAVPLSSLSRMACMWQHTLPTQGASQHHQARGRAADKRHCMNHALQGSSEDLGLAHRAGRLASLLQQPGHAAVLVVQVATGEAGDQAAGLVGPEADAAHCCVGIIQALHAGVAAPWLQHALLEACTLVGALLRGEGRCCGSGIDSCAAWPVAWHRRG